MRVGSTGRVARRALGGIGVLALLATGCSGDDGASSGEQVGAEPSATGDETDGEGAGAPASGGSLTMATWSATAGLDPFSMAGTGNSGGAELAAIYDTLMFYDAETGEFQPRTAESLTSNDDYTEWTLTLREGITFSDGSPYDAEAVVNSMKAHLDPPSNTVSLVTPIESFDTPDDRTVVFTLAAPWNRFPYALASPPGMIVSPSALERRGDDLATNGEGAGAGPFVVEDFSPGESLTLVRNPDYWGGDVPLEELRFIHAGTGAQTLETLQSGVAQAAFVRDPATQADASAAGITALVTPFSANDSIIMNNGLDIRCSGGEPAPACEGEEDGTEIAADTPTSDIRIRRAVAAAIDLDTLNQRVYSGAANLSTDLISSESRWYGGVDGPQYDIDQAKQLVEEVKAEGDWDGSIRVSCHTGLPDWGTAVSGMLEAAGFEVELTDQQEIARNTGAVIVQRNYDLACFGSSINDAEPMFAINRDFHSQFAEVMGGNYAGYVNEDMDDLIAEARSADDDEAMRSAITGIAELYTRDIPWMALSSQPEAVLLGEGVQGVKLNANTVATFDEATVQ